MRTHTALSEDEHTAEHSAAFDAPPAAVQPLGPPAGSAYLPPNMPLYQVAPARPPQVVRITVALRLIFLLFASFWLLVGSIVFSVGLFTQGHAQAMLQGGVCLLHGTACGACAYQLASGRRWAWRLGLILALLWLVAGLGLVWSDLTGLVVMGMAGSMLWALYRIRPARYQR